MNSSLAGYRGEAIVGMQGRSYKIGETKSRKLNWVLARR